MGVFTLIGLAGAAIFIGSYLLLALGRLTSGTPVYYALNLLGIGMALSSHIQDLNIASAIIQSFVFLISVIGLVRWRAMRRPGGSDRDEDPKSQAGQGLRRTRVAKDLPHSGAQRIAAE